MVSVRDGPGSGSNPGASAKTVLHIMHASNGKVTTQRDVWNVRVRAWVLTDDGGSLPYRRSVDVIGLSGGGSDYAVYGFVFDLPSRSMTSVQGIALSINGQMFALPYPRQ